VIKCLLSYLDQFSTVFDGPGTEIDGNMCGNMTKPMYKRKTGCNQFFVGPMIVGAISGKAAVKLK
jgi:hypothetical protein